MTTRYPAIPQPQPGRPDSLLACAHALKKAVELLEADVAAALALAQSATTAVGDTGDQGVPGYPGPDGEQGDPGVPGPPGLPGSAGIQGFPGPPGLDGEDGVGSPGQPGTDGAIGPQGFLGPPGFDGDDGVGIPGQPGTVGAAGIQGFPGPPGLDGEDGMVCFGMTGDAGLSSSLNAVINGGIDVSQENGATVKTLVNGNVAGIVDMWYDQYVDFAATAVVTAQQLANASFPAVLPQFPFALQMKATTALGMATNGDLAQLMTRFEGNRIAHWAWGTTSAHTIYYAIELYSTVAGTAFMRLNNSGLSRFYYRELTVVAGWNLITGTIPGDTSGTWLTDTGVGLVVRFFFAGKDAAPVAPNAWGATDAKQTTNSTNLLGTNNNVVCLTGFWMSPGLIGPKSTAELANLMRPYAEELQWCYRYYWKRIGNNNGQGQCMMQNYGINNAFGYIGSFPVPSRTTAPTMSVSAAGDLKLTTAAGAGSAVATAITLIADQFGFGASDVTITGGTQVAGNATQLFFKDANGYFIKDDRL